MAPPGGGLAGQVFELRHPHHADRHKRKRTGGGAVVALGYVAYDHRPVRALDAPADGREAKLGRRAAVLAVPAHGLGPPGLDGLCQQAPARGGGKLSQRTRK